MGHLTPTTHKSPRAYKVEIFTVLPAIPGCLKACSVQPVNPPEPDGLRGQPNTPRISLFCPQGLHSEWPCNQSHPSSHSPISGQVDQSLLPNYRKDPWSRHSKTLPISLGAFFLLWWTLCAWGGSFVFIFLFFWSQERPFSNIAIWKFQRINTNLLPEQASMDLRWCIYPPAPSPLCGRWERVQSWFWVKGFITLHSVLIRLSSACPYGSSWIMNLLSPSLFCITSPLPYCYFLHFPNESLAFESFSLCLLLG